MCDIYVIVPSQYLTENTITGVFSGSYGWRGGVTYMSLGAHFCTSVPVGRGVESEMLDPPP